MSVESYGEVEQGTEENIGTGRQLEISPEVRSAHATATESPGVNAFPTSSRQLMEGTQETEGF